MLSEPRWKRGEFIFAPKNSPSEESHACGVAKPQGAVLLVLFLPPRKVRGKAGEVLQINFMLDYPIKLGNDEECGGQPSAPGVQDPLFFVGVRHTGAACFLSGGTAKLHPPSPEAMADRGLAFFLSLLLNP